VRSIRLHDEAQREFFEAVDWYSERSNRAAARFITEFWAAGQRACETPELYGEIMDDIRIVRLHRFPWGIVYRIEEEQIHILAVMHLHREPGYWLDRV
jgi:plasmid stabilization system protein ParE